MKRILHGLLLILLIFLFANACFLNRLPAECSFKYFSVPFSDLLQIAIAGIVLYWYVEYKNDVRSKRGFIKNVCERIIGRASDLRMYKIRSKNDIHHIQITRRTIANELKILNDFSKEFGFEGNIEYCEERLDEYWEFISEHENNMEMLIKNEELLENIISKLVNKVELIIAETYKKSL